MLEARANNDTDASKAALAQLQSENSVLYEQRQQLAAQEQQVRAVSARWEKEAQAASARAASGAIDGQVAHLYNELAASTHEAAQWQEEAIAARQTAAVMQAESSRLNQQIQTELQQKASIQAVSEAEWQKRGILE